VSTEEILRHLEGVERRNGYWIALCPAHPDHNPSLSIKEGDNGKPLVHCFAGCSFEEIMTELRAREHAVLVFPKAARVDQRPSKRQPSKVWEVRDVSGELKGLHVRFDRPGGEKECRWKRSSGEWGLNGTPLSAMPLYRSEHARD
jgi:hypothetical protein